MQLEVSTSSRLWRAGSNKCFEMHAVTFNEPTVEVMYSILYALKSAIFQDEVPQNVALDTNYEIRQIAKTFHTVSLTHRYFLIVVFKKYDCPVPLTEGFTHIKCMYIQLVE